MILFFFFFLALKNICHLKKTHCGINMRCSASTHLLLICVINRNPLAGSRSNGPGLSTHPSLGFPQSTSGRRGGGRGVRGEAGGDCQPGWDGLAGNQIHEVIQALRLVALFHVTFQTFHYEFSYTVWQNLCFSGLDKIIVSISQQNFKKKKQTYTALYLTDNDKLSSDNIRSTQCQYLHGFKCEFPIVHRTWTGNSFHTWYFTCFNAIQGFNQWVCFCFFFCCGVFLFVCFEAGGGLISGWGQFTFIKSLEGIRYFKNKLHISIVYMSTQWIPWKPRRLWWQIGIRYVLRKDPWFSLKIYMIFLQIPLLQKSGGNLIRRDYI